MKKLLLTLTLVSTMLLGTTTALAHGDDSSSKGDQTQQVATVTAEDFNFTSDLENQTVTLLYADGTPIANASVTVKNTLSGQDGDIEMNQVADENGVFDYSPWADKGAAILRVTDPQSNAAVEFNIETGAMTIEAGKNKGDSGDREAQQQATSNSTYLLIAGVGVVVVLGTVAAILVQKKKKAAFQAKLQAKKNAKKED